MSTRSTRHSRRFLITSIENMLADTRSIQNMLKPLLVSSHLLGFPGHLNVPCNKFVDKVTKQAVKLPESEAEPILFTYDVAENFI